MGDMSLEGHGDRPQQQHQQQPPQQQPQQHWGAAQGNMWGSHHMMGVSGQQGGSAASGMQGLHRQQQQQLQQGGPQKPKKFNYFGAAKDLCGGSDSDETPPTGIEDSNGADSDDNETDERCRIPPEASAQEKEEAE